MIQSILAYTEAISDTPWGRRGHGAAECYIVPCLNSYTGRVEGGKFTETLVSSSEAFSVNNNFWFNSIDTSCLNAAEEKTLQEAGYVFDSSVPWLPYNLSTNAQDAFNPTINSEANTTIRPDCIYQTFSTEISSLHAYIGEVFKGRVAFAPNVLGGDHVPEAIFQEGNVTFSTINDTFSRVAARLTTWNRENYAQYGPWYATGEVYKTQTCVQIEWAWLAYSAALVLATIIFLLATIIKTRRYEGSYHDYKSSVLALLYHRIGGMGTEGLVSDIQSTDELMKRAQDTWVVLDGSQNTWRFVHAERKRTEGRRDSISTEETQSTI